MTLKIPLGPDQIASANRIYQKLPGWRLADRALAELADSLPGFEQTRCLIKAAAVNALYSTHVLALTAVATHVSSVLKNAELEHAGPELVERLAKASEVPRWHRSFASKFCHFFIDAERFPVFDGNAGEIVSLHLGKSRALDYPAFAADFEALKSLSGFGGPNRELDRYLWIAGAFRAHQAGQEINKEAAVFFKRNESLPGDLRIITASLPPRDRSRSAAPEPGSTSNIANQNPDQPLLD